ncbi:MAG: twin-arginine translocase TatA/TatE family subunit [Pseudomonadota bacterium]
MLDFGLPELLIIAAIAVFVIGPKDIPNIMYGMGRVFRRFQYMRYALSQQFDEVLKAGDIEELRKGVNFEAPQTDEKAADDDEQEAAKP